MDALQDFQRQESPVSGEKLHHYSVTGQLKIAKGLKLLRTISNAFPKGIRFSDFCHTEQKKENNNGSN
ncbi:hypothetical protein HBL79_01025 [Avibacterium paragallinarum]|nr:hypothetical protein HBL79_01025 [Avibacterium paragallinarum]QLD66056.1 hypothetical protein VY92_001145 [Avibacterium paragallinarum]